MNQSLSLELIRKTANKVPAPIAFPADISQPQIAQNAPQALQYTQQSRSSWPVIVGVLLVVGAVIVYFKYQEHIKMDEHQKSTST